MPFEAIPTLSRHRRSYSQVPRYVIPSIAPIPVISRVSWLCEAIHTSLSEVIPVSILTAHG